MVNILPRLQGLLQGLIVTNILTSLLMLILLTSANSYATATASKLRFIADQNFTTGEKFQGTEIGGLSGLSFDRKTNKLLAISDDRSKINEARFYEFSLALDEKSLKVVPTAVVKLKDKDGKYFKQGKPDFEGISLYKDDILISSEGPYRGLLPAIPEFYRFSRTGEFKEFLPIPDKFMPNKKNEIEKMTGSRDNKSLEALSTALDGKTVFVASEDALYQDGEMTTISYASTTRIILYKDLKPVKELAYKLDKIDALKSADLNPADSGLVDIAAIDENNFYAMERSYIPFSNKNIIRIYKCTVGPMTTDISKVESLKNAEYGTVIKELVADMDDYLVQMNPHELDNVEGIAFGPTLANGSRTLIVVSDNNFGKGQRTLFMAFEINVPAKK